LDKLAQLVKAPTCVGLDLLVVSPKPRPPSKFHPHPHKYGGGGGGGGGGGHTKLNPPLVEKPEKVNAILFFF
jgi:hypothetical protein